MKIGTKGHYAVTAMVELAKERSLGVPLSLATIAQTQNIPLNYLELLFVKLRRENLVKSVRGATGGYLLSRPAEKVALWDILVAVGEAVRLNRCDPSMGRGRCLDTTSKCLVHDVWAETTHQLQTYLTKVSLRDVLDGRVAPRQPLNSSIEHTTYQAEEQKCVREQVCRVKVENHGCKKGLHIS